MEFVYLIRKCISCLNKVCIKWIVGNPGTEAPCPHCDSVVRVWP